MAKTKVSEFDAVASNNTDINSVNVAEGCPPSGINNAIREMASLLKKQEVGTDAMTSPDINGGTIDGATIGGSSGVTIGVSDGTVSAPSIKFTSDTNTGIYRGGTDILKFVTAGTDAVTIDASQDVTLAGSLNFADNEKAIFGVGSDLQIWHDTANSIIKDAGTGDLQISASNNITFFNDDFTKVYANFTDTSSTLNHDGSLKLATTATGIDVTGTAVTDGLTVAGNVSVDGGTIKLDGNYPVGSGNVALGATAGSSLTSGTFNTLLGSATGLSLTTGYNNVAIGFGAFDAATDAHSSVAIGTNALTTNTTGAENTAVGQRALFLNTTGGSNVALGRRALENNTTASNNTAVGYQAAYNTTTTGNNAAFGDTALYSNTTGGNAVAIGARALYSMTTANENTAVGMSAAYNTTTGQYNTAIGRSALQANTTASENTAVGYQAGYSGTTATGNTLIGRSAGYSLTTGSYNCFIGGGFSTSGYFMTTGSKNTIIGGFGGNSGGLDIRTSNNYIVLSDGDGNPRLWIAGTNGYFFPNIRSSATANNDLRYNTSNGEVYYQTSSQRYKENIVDLEFDTSNLYNLRPVSYDDKATGERCFGLIAEETFAQIPELVVTRDIDGETLPDSIPYSMLTVAIINEMKKLKEKNDALEARIATLEGE